MKKIISFALVVIMLFSLISCGNKPKVGENETLFTVNEMNLVLPNTFVANESTSATATFHSEDVDIVVLEESFEDFEDLSEYTLDEYATVVRMINSQVYPSEIQADGNIRYMDAAVTVEDENVTYYILFTMVRSENSYWLFKFVCDHELRNEYKPLFIEWTKNVTFR